MLDRADIGQSTRGSGWLDIRIGAILENRIVRFAGERIQASRSVGIINTSLERAIHY
jgi:hypothetical protein